MLPTAIPGILTGMMLAVARAAGETAPLLFTASFNDYWPISGDGVGLNEPTASLAVFIYNFSKMATARPARNRLGRRTGAGGPGSRNESHWTKPLPQHDTLRKELRHGYLRRNNASVPAAERQCRRGHRRRSEGTVLRHLQGRPRHADPHSRRTASRPSSVPRAAARAPCSAA